MSDQEKSPEPLPISKKASCAGCSYWEEIKQRAADGYEGEGLCRRRAPTPVGSTSMVWDGTEPSGEKGVLVAWPRTFESDWCGDFFMRGDLLGRPRAEVKEQSGD